MQVAVVVEEAAVHTCAAGDNGDMIYDNGKTYLYYGKVIAPGHTRITRRQIEVVG